MTKKELHVTHEMSVCVCTHTLKKPAVVTRSGKVLFTVETFKHRHDVCVFKTVFNMRFYFLLRNVVVRYFARKEIT